MQVSGSVTETRVEIWVDFKFTENNESVIPFIVKSIVMVESICSSIQKYL